MNVRALTGSRLPPSRPKRSRPRKSNRIATRACMGFLLSQAGQMGLDVAPGDSTRTTAPDSGRGDTNRIPVRFSVDSPNVTASGACLAITTAGNQGHVADVALNFINK